MVAVARREHAFGFHVARMGIAVRGSVMRVFAPSGQCVSQTMIAKMDRFVTRAHVEVPASMMKIVLRVVSIRVSRAVAINHASLISSVSAVSVKMESAWMLNVRKISIAVKKMWLVKTGDVFRFSAVKKMRIALIRIITATSSTGAKKDRDVSLTQNAALQGSVWGDCVVMRSLVSTPMTAKRDKNASERNAFLARNVDQILIAAESRSV